MTFKEILEKYGVTASELSRRCGVSTSTLSTFVNGRSKCQNMQMTTFLRICKGLDIPFETFVEDLFDGEEENPGKKALLSGDEESLVSDFRGFNAQAKSCLMRVSSAMKLDPSNMQRNRETQAEAQASPSADTSPDAPDKTD
ncbi:helix-turn-helix transcriptional regulator [Collinsella sp. AF20-14LB]|uniref:helix-turn-helix domain-containing protein n=1 Tax=Collinsella sp. AF20-14LB TaxID=2292221 RepID=UPI000E4BDAB5|nr:helix-turn-helix transcriptional regulator [Collinsella sp. AF20-14LB]RGS90981.1 XRE family transcriptional regulator [Collinsella sp. AF20-14LB]